MEVRKLAESVLFADSLDGKLRPAGELTDLRPETGLSIPALPQRPHGLALDDPRPREKFPALSRDGELRQRGLILHHFANHELLAIELMAVFLLRFPQAPAGLRRAVAATMGEEQEHLRLYRDRMEEFGVALGDVPVSRFFWDCLAGMGGPLEYLSGMSLTLEQANLDFSRHYIGRFADIGDEQTAALLQQVYEDEIGHVKLGAEWFEKLRLPSDLRTFWDRYRAELRAPLTPARAIGIGFDHEAREAAGLEPAFIESLQAFSHSKGRPPDLYLFNPSAELHLAGKRVVALPAPLAGLARDLETLPMFLAGSHDAVLVSRPPRAAFLAGLRSAGFALPEFLTAAQIDSQSRSFSSLKPWAWSPDSKARFSSVLSSQPELAPAEAEQRRFEKGWSAELARRWAEQHSADWLAPAETIGTVYTESEAGLEAMARLHASGAPLVIKAALGSAGRGMTRVLSEADLPIAAAWLSRTLARQGAVVIEPWLERVLDLSVQISIAADGAVRVDGVTRFETDRRGQYEGSLLGHPLRDLDEDLRMAVIGPGRGWRMFEHLEEAARFVGAALYRLGHQGPAGMDALVYRDPTGNFRLKPIVEVNPRYTMGHLALRLGGHMGSGWSGRFRIVTQALAAREGAESLAAYVAGLAETTLCLTDVQGAGHAVAVLECNESGG